MRFSFLPAIALATAGILLFSSCVASRHAERRFSKKIQKEVAKSPVFNRAFTGFTLLDPETGKTLADVNGDKYFTPASNTKILTLATCLEVLGDSVPGMLLEKEKPSVLWIRPTADPTLLHPMFESWQPFISLLKKDSISLLLLDEMNWDKNPWGSGWAWDDVYEDYSPERAPLSVYGNVRRLIAVTPDSLSVKPAFWEKYLEKSTMPDEPSIIPLDDNRILYQENERFKEGFEKWIPVKSAGSYSLRILQNVTGVSWTYPDNFGQVVNHNWRTLYSTPLDTVLRRMMYQSDNFIAEQMLLVCAGQKFDILQQDTMIKWILDSVLTSLPQRPRWVDGSGLSRYNLISPRDLAQVLFKLWREQPRDFLLSLFPAGGVNGTVADFYKGKNGKPYVFAKTGGMSGVHCLSGYVVCKSGKTLIFSFMHNNFIGSNRAWKEEMQRILEMIWEKY